MTVIMPTINIDFNIDLTEYNKLKQMLTDAGIPFEEKVRDYFKDTKHYQLIYPSEAHRLSDIVIGFGTYGAEKGLLEQMGLIPSKSSCDVEGWLDAETIFRRWQNHYISHKV